MLRLYCIAKRFQSPGTRREATRDMHAAQFSLFVDTADPDDIQNAKSRPTNAIEKCMLFYV